MGVGVGVKKRLTGRCANTTATCHRICDTSVCVLKGGEGEGGSRVRWICRYAYAWRGGEEVCMVVGVGVKNHIVDRPIVTRFDRWINNGSTFDPLQIQNVHFSPQ